jgi:prepilin-type N-terminal cleavage/methylation domain-containing protein
MLKSNVVKTECKCKIMSNGGGYDKNSRSGFTLVEVIVVLVILAILAAIAIPALTGYIDKANKKAAIAAARINMTAMQTLLSEEYAMGSDWLTRTTNEGSDSRLMHRVYNNANIPFLAVAVGPGSSYRQVGVYDDDPDFMAEWETLTGYIPSSENTAGSVANVNDCAVEALVDPATYQIKGFVMIKYKSGEPEYVVTWNMVESSAAFYGNITAGYITEADDSGYQVFTIAEFMTLIS